MADFQSKHSMTGDERKRIQMYCDFVSLRNVNNWDSSDVNMMLEEHAAWFLQPHVEDSIYQTLFENGDVGVDYRHYRDSMLSAADDWDKFPDMMKIEHAAHTLRLRLATNMVLHDHEALNRAVPDEKRMALAQYVVYETLSYDEDFTEYFKFKASEAWIDDYLHPRWHDSYPRPHHSANIDPQAFDPVSMIKKAIYAEDVYDDYINMLAFYEVDNGTIINAQAQEDADLLKGTYPALWNKLLKNNRDNLDLYEELKDRYNQETMEEWRREYRGMTDKMKPFFPKDQGPSVN